MTQIEQCWQLAGSFWDAEDTSGCREASQIMQIAEDMIKLLLQGSMLNKAHKWQIESFCSTCDSKYQLLAVESGGEGMYERYGLGPVVVETKFG